MSRLTRDGTAEPISRDQILRHARGQGNIIFPVQLTTSRIGNLTRLIHTYPRRCRCQCVNVNVVVVVFLSSFTYEIIVVDDGSTDATAAEVERWVARLGSDAIRLLRLKANQGKGTAVRKVLQT